MAENKEKNTAGRAVVVKHTGSHYLLSHLPQWDPFMAVVKGKLRLDDTTNTNPIAVGDVVEYEGTPSSTSSENPCTIKRVLERRNCIVRRSTNLSRQNHLIAANIDRVFLTVTLKDPEVKLQFVDRFLVTCQAYDVPVTILLNKADIYRGEEDSEKLKDEELAAMAAGFSQIYSNAGYNVIETSVKSGLNIETLRELCKDKVVLFSGQSGVGKSSLINALDPSLSLKTAEISTAHLQGRHTTTFYQMHPISSGGFVVDTPGIRGFGLVNFSKEELSNYFPEMMRVQEGCRFNPCTHTHEPGCAVKEAVERGEISPLRYDSYLAMLEEDGKYRESE